VPLRRRGRSRRDEAGEGSQREQGGAEVWRSEGSGERVASVSTNGRGREYKGMQAGCMSIAMRKGGGSGDVRRAVGHIRGAAWVKGWVRSARGIRDCKGDYTGNTTDNNKRKDVVGADTRCGDLMGGDGGGGGGGGGSRAHWWR
jgi:hypothetical protein